jgi:GT2 family glycosyltransferase
MSIVASLVLREAMTANVSPELVSEPIPAQETPERLYPRVSVLLVNTNELHHLKPCLASLARQTYPNLEIVVVDNASTDGSIRYIQEHHPDVRIEASRENLGYPGGNNKGMEVATGEYFAVLNPDTIVSDDWLEALVDGLERHPEAGLATSKILLQSDPSRINACGNTITITGLTYCRGVGEDCESFDREEDVSAVSGCSFLVRRSLIDEIGPFDAAFVSYLEETDLSLRARLLGYASIYVPASRVWHAYTFRFSEKKCFHIEKNRLYMLAKTFQARTLLSLAPALVMAELLVWTYAATKGRNYLREKARSYRWLWRNRREILAQRRAVQASRVVPDSVVLKQMTPELPIGQIASGPVVRAVQRLLTAALRINHKLSLRVAR